MRIGVVAIPGTFGSSFTSVLDIVRVAESLRPSIDRRLPSLTATVIGARSQVRTGAGMTMEADRLLTDTMDDLDVVLVPTLGALSASDLDHALSLADVRELTAALHDGALSTVPTLAGACTGTFVLAEAGCLDQRRAATCWWLADSFQSRYPAVTVDQTRMVVRSGPIITAGAAFAHIDLAISLVGDVSRRLADTVARHMLIDDRPARSSELLLSHLSTSDQLVTQYEDHVRDHLHEQITVAEIASALHVTRRTLERRVREHTGLTPQQLIQHLRTERARHLQRTTEQSMGQIAARVGYASAVTLRRALQQHPE